MNLPPYKKMMLVNEDGHSTDEKEIFDATFHKELSTNLNQYGYIVPQQPTSMLTQVNKVGNLVYDQTTNQLKVNINGTYRVVQVV